MRRLATLMCEGLCMVKAERGPGSQSRLSSLVLGCNEIPGLTTGLTAGPFTGTPA